MANTDDIWASAPDTPIIPFLNTEQRAQLVNDRSELNVTGMAYDAEGRYGASFVATFIVPSGDAYKYTFTLASKTNPSPRDILNKWIWTKINKEKQSPIPVVLCKKGRSYFFDRPGSESENDTSFGAMPGATAVDFDVPDF